MTSLDKLIISCIKNKAVEPLLKIPKDWLDRKEYIRYKEVIDYYKKNSELIGLHTYCNNHSLDHKEVDSKPTLYERELRNRYVVSEISENIPTFLRNVKKDPLGSLEGITEIVSYLNSENTETRDTKYSDKADERLKEYLDRITNKGITYMSYGHTLLDSFLYGIKQTDLVTFGGRAGSKKTFLLCYIAVLIEDELNRTDVEGDVLFVTNELPEVELSERLDSIRFQLPYADFLGGTLTRPQFNKYKTGVAELKEKPSRIIIIENCRMLEELQSKVRLYRPKIVLLDGSYLMEPENTKPMWEKVTSITRGLKQINLQEKVPILNTTQLGKSTGKKTKGTSFDAQDEFAFANSYSADSDIAFRMYADADMIYRQEVGLQIAKGRRVDASRLLIFLCNLTTMQLDFFEESDVMEELKNKPIDYE